MTAKNPVDRLPTIRAGEFLREALEELATTQAAFAEAIVVSAPACIALTQR
jgi:hypothetical protein